jgi:uncharacterized SAM-binding protein YcdF (DUF218 family)
LRFNFVRNAFAALGLLVAAVTLLPIDGWFLKLLASHWDDRPGDILIVLGAEGQVDAIGLSTYWRCVYAVRVWREGGFKQVVVSGGKMDRGTVVAEQMKSFLISQGIPAEAILVEGASNDTHENALYTARMLRDVPGRKVLLTSDYHMWRAARVFEKTGLAVQPRPYPDLAKRVNSWKDRWSVFVELCIESAKIGYYFSKGWI